MKNSSGQIFIISAGQILGTEDGGSKLLLNTVKYLSVETPSSKKRFSVSRTPFRGAARGVMEQGFVLLIVRGCRGIYGHGLYGFL
jgi:hypothetical protein